MQTNLAWETLLDLPATGPGPLHMRLAAAIRTAIRDGRIPLEAALPPSRTLAADLGVSRWTVTQAYAQLVTEGYLTARTGSATRVSWTPRPGLDRGRRASRAAAREPSRTGRPGSICPPPVLTCGLFRAADGSRRSGPPPRPRRSISWTTPRRAGTRGCGPCSPST